MNNELSPTMQDAVAYAMKHGGKLVRTPGGFWSAYELSYPTFGTTTIQALVSRGVAEYSAWQDRKSGGRFPIEVTFKSNEAKVGSTGDKQMTDDEINERVAVEVVASLRVDRNPLIDAPKKTSKYRNIKTEVDGIRFDSKKEAARYQDLRTLEQAGEIARLVRQLRYPLFVGDVKICDYVADFVYMDTRTGKTVAEDCKGVRTPTYRLKRKLMKAVWGIDILET